MLLNYNIIPSLIMVCCFITKRIFFYFISLFKKSQPLTHTNFTHALSLSLFLSSLLFSVLFAVLMVSSVMFCFAIFISFIYQFMHCFSKGKKALALIFVSIFFRLQNAAFVILFVCVFLLELN